MVTINTDITTSFPSLPPFSPASSSEFCLRCDAFHTPCNEALPVLPSQAFLSFDDNADPHCYEELFKTFSNDLVVPLTSLLECAQTLQFEFSSCIQPQAFDTLGFGDLVSGFCNQVREYVVKIAANFVTDVGVLVGSQAKKSFYEALGDLSSSFCSVFIDFVTGAKKLVASVAVFVNNFVTLMSLFVVQPLFEYGAKIAYLLLDIVFGVAEKASGASLSSLVAQAYTPSQNPLVDLCSLIAPKCLENFGKQAAALNSIIMLGERCHKHVALALNWIYNQYLAHKTGIDPDKIPILSFSPEAVRYMDAFDDALSDANVRACKTDPVARAKVSNLRQLGDFIIAKFPSSVPREARDAFHKMHSRVVVQQQLNNTYCDGVSQTRVEPIGVALVGPPGIGKDTVLRMMLEDIAKNFGVENKLLTKNASSAYYSNFSNQPFLLYSEFQSVKPVARVDGVCEAAEILNVINITPHLLVVESEPLKAVSYANFAAVFLTSNSENFDLSQLTEPEAFHRRFQLRLIPVCLKGFGFRTAPGSAWSNFPLVFSKLAGIPSTVLTRADFKFIVLDPKNKILGFVDYDNVMTMISQARDKKLADFRNSLVPQGKDDESELKKALDELDLIQVESNDLSNPKSYVVACCLAALACNVRSVRLVVSQQAYFAYIKKLNVVHPIMFALFNSKHKDRKLLSEVFLQYTDSPQAVDIGIFADLTDQIHEPDLWFNLLLESEIHTFVRLKHARYNVSRCSSLFYSIVCKDPVLAYKFSDEGKFFVKYFQKFDNAYTLVKHRIMLDPCMQFLIGYFGGCVLFYAGAKIFSYLFGKKEKNDSPQVLDPEMGTSSDDYMKDTHLGRHTPGSARSLKNANYRLRNHKRGILQAQAAHDERAVTAARVIMTRNTVRVCFYSAENIVISSVYGIYLKAKFLLLPRHILPMFKICPILVISTGYNKNVIRLDTKSVLLSSSIDDRYDMLVAYHPQMMRYPDITNHLITWEELSQVSSTNIIFCKPKIAGKENEGDTQVLAHARYYETSTEPYEFRGAKNRTTGYLAYDVHTIPGDCGAPIFASNNLIEHKLLAFHTVANRTTKVGMGQVLFREVVLDHINSIATDDVVPQSDELFQKYPLGPLPEDDFFEIPNHAVLGVVDKKLSSTSNIRTTKLQASPFQKDLLHGSYQPAGMAANYVEGDLVIHNLQKKARHHKTGHKAEFDRAWDALYENLVRTSFPPRSPETTLTFVQAVDGIDGEPFSDALPKKTATGWPDSHEYKHATKKPIFESESLTKQVFDDVQNVLEECKTKVPSTVFTLFGKDELRTIEKIQKGSIRLVFGCPTKITIAFRMLFGPFMRWVMSNHVVNGVAVGLNVHGPGWDLLARTLLAKGNKMIDFDVESFDFNECVEVLFGFPDIVNRWCGDDEETQEQRRNLWSSMMNALVIYLCYIFMRSGNICSGCPATAVVNSLIVIVFMLVAWRRTMKTCKLAYYEDEGNFFKYCAIIAFGDDNIVSVAPEVSSYFTPTAICSALAEIGVPVTDAATKTSFTGDIAFKPLSECVFLQRRFVIDPETQRYVAPLRLESILKMISWYRQSVDFTVAINDNLQTGSMELSLHGFDVYEHYRKIIEKVIANKKLPYTMMKFERALSSQLLRSYEIPDQELVAQAGGPEKGPKVRDSVHRLVLEAEPFREPPVSALDTLSLISLENNGELKNYYCLQNETSLIHFYEWLYKQPDNLLLPRFQRYFLKIDLAEYEAYWSTLNRIQHWYLVYYITNATRGGLQKFQPFEIHLLGDPSDENLMLQYRQMHARFAFCTGADNLVAQASYGEQHQILEFTDDSTSFHLEKPGMVVCDLQKQDISEMRQHDIIDFLGRPFELPTVTLATGGSSLDILGTWTFPDVLFTSPMYLEKLKNFRNFRANINFKVMVNAAPTDTGMLRLFFSPFQSQVGTRTANSTLACKTGYPGQDIDIGPGVALTHVMPYCAPMSGYDLPNQTGTIGEFELIYVSPYRSNGTGTPTVTLLVWCSDVQLTVPTNTDLVFPPVSFSMKSLEKETALLALDYLKRYEAKKGDVLEAQAEDHTRKKNETGTISDITGKFGTAFNSLEKVPLIGSASKAVGGVLNTTSKIAKSVGYCKEPNLSCVQPFANVPGRGFTNMVGMDDSVKLAGHPDNHLEKVDGLSATTRDEMDIATFASKEAICHSFTFGTTTPVGTILAAIPVCPGYCQTGTTTTVDSTPLGFVGGPFLFWRGSIYYRVKVVKNSFYSFRLRISFVPGLRFDQITAATNFDTCYTKFVDMRGVDSVNVKIPYNPPYPWLRNFYGTLSSTLVGFAGPNASLGTLVISLASRVLVPTTCPDTMDGFIYIRGGEDIRFAFANFTNVRVNQPFVPLAESTESVVSTVLEKVDYEPGDVLQAQAEDGPTNAFAGASPSDTQTTGPISTSGMLTSTSVNSTSMEQACIGEEFTNVRQLIKRFAQPAASFTTNDTTQTLNVDPAYFGTGANVEHIPLWYYSWGYRFYRGSTRYKWMWTPTTTTTEVLPRRIVSYMDQVTFTTGPFAPTLAAGFTLYAATAQHVTYPQAFNPVHEVELPFFRQTAMSVISSTLTGEDNNRPVMTIRNDGIPTGSISTWQLKVAAGDDFEFLYQIGTPRLNIAP